jgi:hypothetical protein
VLMDVGRLSNPCMLRCEGLVLRCQNGRVEDGPAVPLSAFVVAVRAVFHAYMPYNRRFAKEVTDQPEEAKRIELV